MSDGRITVNHIKLVLKWMKTVKHAELPDWMLMVLL